MIEVKLGREENPCDGVYSALEGNSGEMLGAPGIELTEQHKVLEKSVGENSQGFFLNHWNLQINIRRKFSGAFLNNWNQLLPARYCRFQSLGNELKYQAF